MNNKTKRIHKSEEADRNVVKDLWLGYTKTYKLQRVEAPVESGECVECGALCEGDDWLCGACFEAQDAVLVLV